jgi:hypothetical protein
MRVPEATRRNRSKLGNGRRIPDEVDGRTKVARRYRDLFVGYLHDLQKEEVSESELSLCRAAAVVTLRVEALQTAVGLGEDVSVAKLTMLTNALARTLTALGLRRAENKPHKPIVEIPLRDRLALHEQIREQYGDEA